MDDTGSEPDQQRLGLIAVAAGVAVVLLVGGFLLLRDDDADEVETGTDDTTTTVDETSSSTTTTTTQEPPSTSVPTGPDGTGSPLVGTEELIVRETYPLVRVVERDGESLISTDDLRPGRIDLSVQGGTVTAATTEGCDQAPVPTPQWVLQACDPDPSTDGPDSFGRAVGDPGALTLEVGFNADEAYQGLALTDGDGDVLVTGTDGSSLSLSDITAGEVVWVWTDACQESDPLQCEIAAIVVDRPAG